MHLLLYFGESDVVFNFWYSQTRLWQLFDEYKSMLPKFSLKKKQRILLPYLLKLCGGLDTKLHLAIDGSLSFFVVF